jgi:hypothetical protein
LGVAKKGITAVALAVPAEAAKAALIATGAAVVPVPLEIDTGASAEVLRVATKRLIALALAVATAHLEAAAVVATAAMEVVRIKIDASASGALFSPEALAQLRLASDTLRPR